MGDFYFLKKAVSKSMDTVSNDHPSSLWSSENTVAMETESIGKQPNFLYLKELAIWAH